jgi:hypothetical protein
VGGRQAVVARSHQILVDALAGVQVQAPDQRGQQGPAG